jgi:hypothetical protein
MKKMKKEKQTKAEKPQLSEAARLAFNAHMREYKRNNREKIRKYHIEYWERKAANALITDTSVTMETSVTTVSKCKYCRKDLTDKRAGAKYCSTNCRVNFNRKTNKLLAKQTN